MAILHEHAESCQSRPEEHFAAPRKERSQLSGEWTLPYTPCFYTHIYKRLLASAQRAASIEMIVGEGEALNVTRRIPPSVQPCNDKDNKSLWTKSPNNKQTKTDPLP